MSNNTKYTCSKCGQVHDEWPALAFNSPTSYNALSEIMRAEIGELTSDFCVIKHPEQTDRFIRGTLTIKVFDHCEDLEYGIWVSLSEKSFKDYAENFSNPDHEAQYFGWLSNDIAGYEPSVASIPTTVLTRKDGIRPQIIPFKDFDHPLVLDYYAGISKADAERTIQRMLENISNGRMSQQPAKPWWKIW